jgi:uncharacterized membrane-anchored protein
MRGSKGEMNGNNEIRYFHDDLCETILEKQKKGVRITTVCGC